MLPRENRNNAYAKFGGTNKEYYGIFRSGLFVVEMYVKGKVVQLQVTKCLHDIKHFNCT